MKPDHIICHYAEIGLKGKNRRFFEDRLKENIKTGLKIHCPGSYESVQRMYGRIMIKLTQRGQNSTDDLTRVFKNTFGIAYFAFALQSAQDMESLKKDSLKVLSHLDFGSFRITARKGDRTAPFTTRTINETVGAFIVAELGRRVNLDSPDVTCFIDLFQDSAFIYIEKVGGRGGLPVGVSGKVVVMLSGGIDSPVSAYFAMKRGARATFLHFHSVPYTTRASIDKVGEIIHILNLFQFRSKLILVELAPIQKEVMVKTPERFRVILYRRFMFRIAEAIARRERAQAVVTGECLGQVASQTLENMDVIGNVTEISILRPLIGFDKQEIIKVARDIGTYEISILPDQDCCSLFVPKRPATRSRKEDVSGVERALDVERLVQTAIESAEETVIS